MYRDATFGTMLSALDDIKSIASAFEGDLNVIFYYAGHGVPSESDKAAYLLPVDASGQNTEVCLSTKRLYDTLDGLHAKRVLVFMDACFSGVAWRWHVGIGSWRSVEGEAGCAKGQHGGVQCCYGRRDCLSI